MAIQEKHLIYFPDCWTPEPGGGAPRQPMRPPRDLYSPQLVVLVSSNKEEWITFTTATFSLLDYEFTAGCVSGNRSRGKVSVFVDPARGLFVAERVRVAALDARHIKPIANLVFH